MTVVAALEFDDLIAPREATSEPDGRHRGLGAGADHADFFDRWDPIGDHLRHLDFVRIRDSVGDAFLGRFMDCAGDGERGMAEDVWAPRADVVDVGFAIGVLDTRTLGAFHEKGVTIDVFKGPNR